MSVDSKTITEDFDKAVAYLQRSKAVKTEDEKKAECNAYWAKVPYEELLRMHKAVLSAKESGHEFLDGDYTESAIMAAMKDVVSKNSENFKKLMDAYEEAIHTLKDAEKALERCNVFTNYDYSWLEKKIDEVLWASTKKVDLIKYYGRKSNE